MGRVFNVTADCKPEFHYMVDIRSRLDQIKGYVDQGAYFAINRARQYGKTTTLRRLREYLKDQYYVISMDFQMQMSYAKFRSEHTFSVAFAKAFVRIVKNLEAEIPEKMAQAAEMLGRVAQSDREELELVELFQYLSDICKESDRPLVLMIDEVTARRITRYFLIFWPSSEDIISTEIRQLHSGRSFWQACMISEI